MLALLCSQWWTAWSAKEAEGKGWQTWCDLVILSSSVLGSPTLTTKTSSQDDGSTAVARSDEAKQAAIKVLDELLSPRFRLLQPRTEEEEKANDWEWDGVSELPSLDEITAQANRKAEKSRKGQDSAKEEMQLVFPIREHLTYATADRIAKGAISFVLSSCFTIAESSQETTQARKGALGVARNALLLWIGGTCSLPTLATSHGEKAATWLDISALHCIDIPSPASSSPEKQNLEVRKAAAQRLRPLLPGITSSLTRLATSRLKTKQDGSKAKTTPSAVVAESIGLLGDLLRATLSDACLVDVLNTELALNRTETQASTEVKVTNLEDFARFDSLSEIGSVDEHDTSSLQDPGMQPESTAGRQTDKEVQWTLSTLAQVHLALKNFSPLTAPSLAGTSLPSSTHPAVQTSMLRLAVVLLAECSQAFSWLDKQLDSMARLDPTTHSNGDSTGSVETILTWIIDLASTQNSTSAVKNAKAAFEALQKQGGELGGKLRDGSVMWGVLIAALDRLPGVIGAGDDAAVSRLVLRVSTILQLLSDSTTTSAADLTKLAQDIQQSSIRLLRPLKVEQLTYFEDPPSETTNPPWRLQPAFKGLEASTSRQLSRMFQDFGRLMALSLVSQVKSQPGGVKKKGEGGEMFGMIAHLINLAEQLRSIRVESGGVGRGESVVCLVVASEMLCDVAGVLGDMEVGMRVGGGSEVRKQVRRVAHKLGKKVFGLVMDVLDGDAEVASSPSTFSSRTGTGEKAHNGVLTNSSSELTITNQAEEQTLVEKVKGISLAPTDLSTSTPTRLGPVLDLAFVRSADLTRSSPSTQLSTQQRFAKAQRDLDLSSSLLFSLLSSSSRLLGQSFRPLLLRSAYAIVSAMSISHPHSPSSDVVREASRAAMRDIAFNTAYGDVKNCLLDHADYILGAACQRLIVGLDEELRLLANSEAKRAEVGVGAVEGSGVVVPLVSAQRAPFVLVEMIRVLGSEVVPMVEDAIDEVLDALDRFHGYEGIADGLLGVLGGILECMAAEQAGNPARSRRVDVLPSTSGANEVDEFKSWLSTRRQDSKAFDDVPPDNEASTTKEEKEEEDKPTKSQQVTTQILTKSTFFLTHPSPSLRIRVLHLLRHGLLTLAPQARTAELLPIINSAWPFVMTRLGLSYSTLPSTTSKLSPIINLSPTAAGRSAKRDGGEEWMMKTEENLVEKDVGVWFAAAKYVEAAVEHVPDFVGKRVVDDAWPRFELLLRLIRVRFDPRYQHHRYSTRQNVTLEGTTANLLEANMPNTGLIQNLTSNPTKRTPQPHSHTNHPFIHPSSTTLPAQLTICIITTLNSIVHHLNSRMPDEIAWSITTNPSLLEALDTRQPPSLVRAAEGLYKELVRRNGEATRWMLMCAFPKAAAEVGGGTGKGEGRKRERKKREGTPCFMVHTRVQVHGESMHCVLEGM